MLKGLPSSTSYESVSMRLRNYVTFVTYCTCPNRPMLILSLPGVASIHDLHTEFKILHTALIHSPRHGIPHPTSLILPRRTVQRIDPFDFGVPLDHLHTNSGFAAVTW